MKRKMLGILLFLAMSLTACGGNRVETIAVAYDMKFENQTGIDVTKLEMRHAEDAQWSEIPLTDGIWENGYRIPVSMQGEMPVAENGWQLQLTFEDGEMQKIWDGVEFADQTIISFSIAEDTHESLFQITEATAEE